MYYTWLIEHVANILNMYKRTAGGDGLTAFYRMRGRPWRIPIPEFGETVEYRRKGKTSKFALKHYVGVLIGCLRSQRQLFVGDIFCQLFVRLE